MSKNHIAQKCAQKRCQQREGMGFGEREHSPGLVGTNGVLEEEAI